uniref:Protein arginine N-methyltransferase n=1 Tax=Hemiselmis andersenii TaxID=464988 RepID=A0A6U2IWI4_HEMAN
MGDVVRIGRLQTCVPDAHTVMDALRGNEMHFAVLPLVHPRARREFANKTVRDEPFTRSDLTLSSHAWSTNVVGALSPWLNLDSPCARVRTDSEKALKQEVMWAQHISCPAVLTPIPAKKCPNFARALYSNLTGYTNTQFMVRIPLVWTDDPEASSDPWETWNDVRSVCEHHACLSVALELTSDLPDQDTVEQWGAEQVKMIIVPTSIFLTNASGFPVLSKRHQAILNVFFARNVDLVLSGRPRHQSDMLVYTQYLQHLYQNRPQLSDSEAFEQPYWDYLQIPLQPLADNLESQTYEVFERDPVKYVNYQEAVRLCLLDLMAQPGRKEERFVIMVVGAGRGPLVRASLQAAEQAGANVFCYALDKNPNAVVTLRNMRLTEGWVGKVEVVHSDMRAFHPDVLADILVSELLGSFGDNELSPECLDGAQSFLKPGTGVSIPQSYTSAMAPISSAKLHQEVKSYNDVKHFETTYVVKMHAHRVLSRPQDCWTFDHPNHETPIDNARYSVHRFPITRSSCLTGFAGYFDAKLYGDVHISIHPETFSTGMFSWFPLLIPIRTPIYLPAGCEVEAHIWRRVEDKKVWYEWVVTSPSVGPLNNLNGRSFSIGL